MSETVPAGETGPPAGAACLPSVRTTFRRTLGFAGICAGAVFVLIFTFQLFLHVSLTKPDSWDRYVGAMMRWCTWQRGGLVVEEAFGALALGLGLAVYFVLMALLLGKWRWAAGGGVAAVVVTTTGLALPPALPFAMAAAWLVAYVMHCALVAIPMDRVEAGKMRTLRYWRHFRLRNFVWLFLSGWLLYYLIIMGFFLAADALLHLAFLALGHEGRLHILPRYPSGTVRLASALYTAVLASIMSFYHFMCSSYLVCQLDRIVDAGRAPIGHRKFWWPFRKARDGKAGEPGAQWDQAAGDDKTARG